MYTNRIQNDFGDIFPQNLSLGRRTSKNQTCRQIQELHVEILPIQEGFRGQKCGETYCKKEYQCFCVCINM